MGKQPKLGVEPKPAKEPRSPEGRSYNHDRPAWRISRIELADPFGWHQVEADQLKAIRIKLAQFETMTWNEILVGGKTQHHSVPVSQLSKRAQDRLDTLFKGNVDVEELVSLRLSGRERVWGIRDQAVLSLLWWDPEHDVCPSLLKHT
jgi:hypothetical protein